MATVVAPEEPRPFTNKWGLMLGLISTGLWLMLSSSRETLLDSRWPQTRKEKEARFAEKTGPRRKLEEQCPFIPSGHTGPDFRPEHTAAHQGPTDAGLIQGLADLMNEKLGEDSKEKIVVDGEEKTSISIVDMTAGLGQMYKGLSGADIEMEYTGLDWAGNIMDIADEVMPIRGDKNYVVPFLCWGNPSRPLDLKKEFDMAIAIVGNGQYISPEGRTKEAFLDNLVRASGDTIVLAWRTQNSMRGELMTRGAIFDERATKKLKEASNSKFLKEFVEVYRLEESLRPMVQ